METLHAEYGPDDNSRARDVAQKLEAIQQATRLQNTAPFIGDVALLTYPIYDTNLN